MGSDGPHDRRDPADEGGSAGYALSGPRVISETDRDMPTVEVRVWLRGTRVRFERAQFGSVARSL